MKKILSSAALLVVAGLIYSAQYKITDVTYHIKGITRQYALEQNIKIDKNRIFTSEEEFMTYFNDIKQQFHNQRIFAQSDLDFTVREPDEAGISGVSLTVSTIDSHHLLVVPYPKYNSNSGLDLKLKVKDTNFFGSMDTMNGEFSFQLKQDSTDDSASNSDIEYVFGISTDFDIPFKSGPFNSKWENAWTASYTIGDSSLEWDMSTGFVFSLPFDGFSLDLELKQSAVRNYDSDYTKYGDDTYYTEYAGFSIPITLQYIDNWGKILYTPAVTAKYNWDKDGIDSSDDNLSSPLYTVGHTLSTSRINWIGNFRQGLSLTFNQSIGYNSQKDDIVPHVSAEANIFLAFKYLGMCMDAYAFAYQNSSEKIGSRLRGIRDDQKYSSDTSYADDYALKVGNAIVVNMDMPFHIFTFDFDETKHLQFLHVFNCELQIAPFFDFALAKNKVTGTNFYYKDGFYCGGLEFLVFPQKWRSLVIRASAGVDLGRYVLKRWINTDWRKDVSLYEIEIGVGLHY